MSSWSADLEANDGCERIERSTGLVADDERSCTLSFGQWSGAADSESEENGEGSASIAGHFSCSDGAPQPLRGIRETVTPDEIRRLRDKLGCTMSELAQAVGVPVGLVVDWESGEKFPTKKAVAALTRLERGGRDALSQAGTPRRIEGDVWARLAEPELWKLVRKLLAHPRFLDEARDLAQKYPDPAD